MALIAQVLWAGALFLLCLGVTLDLSVAACDTGRIFVGSVNEEFPDLLPVNGIYLTQEGDQHGVPVFKHETLDFYLYHVEGNLFDSGHRPGYWAVGHKVGGADALLSVPSAISNPGEVGLDWRAWNSRTQTWQRDLRLKAKCVPDSFRMCNGGPIVISGLGADHLNQAWRLGVYVPTNETFDLRPVYKHQLMQQYLFFHRGLWLIGPEVGTVSGGLYVPDSAWKPEFIIQDWVVFNGHHLDDDPTVRVNCLDDVAVSADLVDSQETVRCQENYCFNGGKCVNADNGQILCRCSPGSFGDRCQEVVSCHPIPTSSSYTTVQTTERKFLDVAFVTCLNHSGERGVTTGVVCQSDGTWSSLPNCHPGIREVTPEVQTEADPGPITSDLPRAIGKLNLSIMEVINHLDNDRD